LNNQFKNGKEEKNGSFKEVNKKRREGKETELKEMISFRSGKRRSGVNFTDVLRTAFTLIDPKSAKTTVKLSVILQIWDLRAEMLSVNMLVKLTPGYFFYFFRKQLSDKKVWLFFE